MYMSASQSSLPRAAPDRPKTREPARQDHDRVVAKNGSAAAHAAREAEALALLSQIGLTVRSVRATDKSALSALFDRLSPRSRHYHFLGPKRMLSLRELANLTDIDHVEREALALVGPDGRLIAVARYGPVSDDPNAAEVALAVADEWQGRGIGCALASLLIAEARGNRIVRLQAMTLAENHPSRKLLRRLSSTVTSVDGDVMTFEMQLVEPEESHSLPRTHHQPHHFGEHEMSAFEQRQAGTPPPAPLPKDATESLAGIDQLRAVRDSKLGVSPMHALMNMRLTVVEDGRVVFVGTPDDRHYNPQGTIHGAFTAAMLDSAMGCAVLTKLPAGAAHTTLEFKINLVRSMSSETGEVTAEGRVVHSGRRISTAEGKLTRQDAKIIAHASTTCMVLN